MTSKRPPFCVSPDHERSIRGRTCSYEFSIITTPDILPGIQSVIPRPVIPHNGILRHGLLGDQTRVPSARKWLEAAPRIAERLRLFTALVVGRCALRTQEGHPG